MGAEGSLDESARTLRIMSIVLSFLGTLMMCLACSDVPYWINENVFAEFWIIFVFLCAVFVFGAGGLALGIFNIRRKRVASAFIGLILGAIVSAVGAFALVSCIWIYQGIGSMPQPPGVVEYPAPATPGKATATGADLGGASQSAVPTPSAPSVKACAGRSVATESFTFKIPRSWNCGDEQVRSPAVAMISAPGSWIVVRVETAWPKMSDEELRDYAQSSIDELTDSGYDTDGLKVAADLASVDGQKAAVVEGTASMTIDIPNVNTTATMEIRDYFCFHDGSVYVIAAFQSNSLASVQGSTTLDEAMEYVVDSWKWQE